VDKQRFVNLNLLTIRYPFTAIISILHRLSGVFVFLLIPFLLWLLDVAISSETGFSRIEALLRNPFSKLTLWLFLVGLGYHLIAGIRHLMMDMGWGESLSAARLSGQVSLVVACIWMIAIGIWLW
jgi:succinate dehydrogenase / fumarate reductase cytochrome b subunit